MTARKHIAQIETLIGLLLSGQKLPADFLESLQAWLIDQDEDEANKYVVLEDHFDRLVRAAGSREYALESWPELAKKLGMDPDMAERMLKNGIAASNPDSVRPAPRKRLLRGYFIRYAVAAAVCLAAIPVFYLMMLWGTGSREFSAVETITATPSDTLRLPDGSKVLMRSNTILSYSDDFVKNRKVSINGEAFFYVLHDERSQFTVESKSIKVVVTGTEFNVRSYDTESYAEVILISGSVAITSGDLNFTLKPNERATIDKIGGKVDISAIAGGELMKARGTNLQMEGVSLDKALTMIGGYFGAVMDIPSDLPATGGIVFDLDRDATLEDALFLLRAANPVFDYHIRDSFVSITKQ